MRKRTYICQHVWDQLPEEAQLVLNEHLSFIIIPSDKYKLVEIDPEDIGLKMVIEEAFAEGKVHSDSFDIDLYGDS